MRYGCRSKLDELRLCLDYMLQPIRTGARRLPKRSVAKGARIWSGGICLHWSAEYESGGTKPGRRLYALMVGVMQGSHWACLRELAGGFLLVG